MREFLRRILDFKLRLNRSRRKIERKNLTHNRPSPMLPPKQPRGESERNEGQSKFPVAKSRHEVAYTLCRGSIYGSTLVIPIPEPTRGAEESAFPRLRLESSQDPCHSSSKSAVRVLLLLPTESPARNSTRYEPGSSFATGIWSPNGITGSPVFPCGILSRRLNFSCPLLRSTTFSSNATPGGLGPFKSGS